MIADAPVSAAYFLYLGLLRKVIVPATPFWISDTPEISSSELPIT